MFSPDALPNIIERIDGWTQDELAKNIDDVLPVLTNSLRKVEQKALSLRSVHVLLNRCLTCVPVCDIDSVILQHALPIAKDIFVEALEGITVVLHDAENMTDEEIDLTLKSLHHVCYGLIDQLKKVLFTVSSFSPLPAVTVSSMPCTILQLLWTSFTHCRESEELYGSSREYVMALFNNSQMLLSSLDPVLRNGLQFNLNTEEDETLFRNVLESLACVAKSTTTLGITVQTVAWTMYVTLVQRYSGFRDVWSSSDVSSPIETLATSVSDVLSVLLSDQLIDMNLGIKTLTVLRFLVRVLTKLCSIFTGYLTDKCMPSVFRLLELLHRCCVMDSNGNETKSMLLKEAEKRIGIASASLISSLLDDRSFVQEYFCSTRKSTIVSPLPWLLMGTSICQTLVNGDSEIRIQWMNNPEAHILKTMFLLLGSCHPELCSDRRFSAVHSLGKPSQMVDLYEYVLIPVGSLALLASSDNFSVVEATLVQNITQTDHWKAVFALDLWCIIARQSPVSVRVRHALFALQFLSTQQRVLCNSTQIHLRLLLRRLWPLLPSQQQETLLNKFPPTTLPDVWECVNLQTLPENILPNEVLCITTTAVDIFLSNPDVETYKEMIKKIKCADLVLTIDNSFIESNSHPSSLITSLPALWMLFGNSVMKYAAEGWLSYFFSAICDVTVNLCPFFKNIQVIEILMKSLDIFTCNAAFFKLRILSLLQAYAEKVFDSDAQQKLVFQAIVNIFVAAILDPNNIIQQEALYTFEYFAHVTPHEDIIKMCLKSDKILQENVSRYLKKTPIDFQTKFEGYKHCDYLKLQSKMNFLHQCKMKNKKPLVPVEVNQQSLKSADSFSQSSNDTVKNNDKCDSELTSAIKRIQIDAQIVSRFCKDPCLTKSMKINLFTELDKVRKSINEVCFLLKE